MKNRRGIRHQPSDKAPDSFYDLVDSFSEEEWKLLQLWQKELYNNLMKELQQAFNLLGPLIATTVFSLKPKVKEDACSMELQDLDTMDNVNLYSEAEDIATALSYSVKREEESYSNFETSESISCTTQTADMAAAVSFSIKSEEEMFSKFEKNESISCTTPGDDLLKPANVVRMEVGLEPGFVRHYDTERREGRTHPTIGTTDMAAAVSFSIKSEEELYSHLEKSESISCTTQLEVTTPVASIGINEVGEIYAIDMQDDPSGEISNSHLGKGNANRKKNVSNAVIYNDKSKLCKMASKNLKVNVIRRANLKNNICPMWPGNDGELQDNIKTQPRSGYQQQGEFGLQKTVSCMQLSEIYDNRESTVRTDNNNPCEKSTLRRPELGRSYQKDSTDGHHQGCKSKVRYPKVRYPCTECGKTLLGMSSLVVHQRIHTGERPFDCTVCGKRFKQKGDLHRHQQVHTGARPYQCNICQKTFTQKWLLHAHERTHIVTK